MTVTAHVAGVPAEELIPVLAGTGTAVLLVRFQLSAWLRRTFRE